MLLRFTVENYASLKEENVLDLTPSYDKVHPENMFEKANKKANRFAIVYGANASGKSNLYMAMTHAINMIRQSNNRQINQRLHTVPFKFDDDCIEKPTWFQFDFIASDNKRYVYGYEATQQRIVSEYLYCFNSAKATMVFDFSDEEKKINRAYENELRPLISKNTENKLFISTATAWNAESTRVPYQWLESGIQTFNNIDNLKNRAIAMYREDELAGKSDRIDFAKKIMQVADVNISGIEFKSNEVSSPPVRFMIDGQEIAPYGAGINFEASTLHMISDGNKKELRRLSLYEESLGTQMLFYYAPILKDIFDNGTALYIDELDRSLHPYVVKCIVDLFTNQEINKNGAQLIANTHETYLLNLDFLRRDQVYFVEKSNESGVSALYCLNEFPVRKTDNIEKNYLLGRYGAVPAVFSPEVI